MDVAKVEIKMPEEFLLKVSRLSDQTDSIIPKVLAKGGEVVVAKVKSNLDSVIASGTKYPSTSTGELQSSLGVTSAKQNRDGNFNVKVGFSEPRRNGKSNAKIANIIEYGKHGQPAKPFLKPAKSATRKTCIDAMTQKLNEELNNL